MKILENSSAREETKLSGEKAAKQEWLDDVGSCEYFCRSCGRGETVDAHYQETTYGSARVTNLHGELDNYNSDRGSDDFTINYYRCSECGEEHENLLSLIISSVEEGWEAYKENNSMTFFKEEEEEEEDE